MTRYTGFWSMHSAGYMGDEGVVYVTPEEYLVSPMPYIDETDPEAVEHEMRERKSIIGMKLKVTEDGKFYTLVPLPAGVTQEEVDAAVAAGEINLMDGMMTDAPVACEVRDGQLWAELGFSDDGWCRLSNDEGMLEMITYRFIKD